MWLIQYSWNSCSNEGFRRRFPEERSGIVRFSTWPKSTPATISLETFFATPLRRSISNATVRFPCAGAVREMRISFPTGRQEIRPKSRPVNPERMKVRDGASLFTVSAGAVSFPLARKLFELSGVIRTFLPDNSNSCPSAIARGTSIQKECSSSSQRGSGEGK